MSLQLLSSDVLKDKKYTHMDTPAAWSSVELLARRTLLEPGWKVIMPRKEAYLAMMHRHSLLLRSALRM